MARPYKVGHYKFVGFMAVVMSGLMLLVYCIPGSGGSLVFQEWFIGRWLEFTWSCILCDL